jgi:hypothetical protein
VYKTYDIIQCLKIDTTTSVSKLTFTHKNALNFLFKYIDELICNINVSFFEEMIKDFLTVMATLDYYYEI